MDAYTKPLDRVAPDYFEADEEGYWQGSEETGADGRARGMSFALYVLYPWTLSPDAFSDAQAGRFVQWVQDRYPGGDWIFDADEHATFEVYGDHRAGESSQDLAMRLTVDNPAYNRVRNEGTIFYTLRDEFAQFCGIDLDTLYTS